MNVLLRILLIEDNPGDADLIAEMLNETAERVELKCVTRLSAGIEQLNAGEFDVVLLDLGLPDSSGIDTLIRLIQIKPGAPVVVLTGLMDETAGTQAVKEGAQDYLVKGQIEKNLLVRSMKYAIERKKIQLALRENEAQYRALFENSIDAVLITKPDGSILEANAEACLMFGLTEEEICRRGRSGILDLSDPRLAVALEERERTGRFKGELLMRRGDGSTFPGEISSGLFRDGEDNIKTSMIIREVSDRKQKEMELHRLNRTLLARSKSSKAMINAQDESWYLDEVCRIIVEDCDHALVWIGFAEQDEGRTVRPVAHAGFEDGYIETVQVTWSDTERGRGPVGTAIRTGKPSIFLDLSNDSAFAPWREEAMKRGFASVIGVPLVADGKAFGSLNIYSRYKYPFSDSEVQLLVDLAADLSFGITAIRRRIEQVNAEAALKDSNEKIEQILDSTAEGIYGIDLAGHCAFCNPACIKILGYHDEHEIIGKNMHHLLHHTNADGTPYPVEECNVHNSLQSGVYYHKDRDLFWRLDGSSFQAEYWTHPILKNGIVQGAVVSFVDRSEQVALENQLRQSQKMEAIGMLAGGIAHDFNNILSAMVGYGHVALMKMSQDDPNRQNIERIMEAADRAAKLVKGLLAFSRKQALERKPVDLNTVLRNVENLLARIIGEDIEVRFALTEGALPIVADAGQLEQVVMNMATNARDAMQQGGSFAIETAIMELGDDFVQVHGYGTPGSYAMITLSDTGMGMNEETRRKIFDPFFTTKEVGKGTGLGLAMAYGIIKQHEGFINVYSEPGQGTTFKIYLPLSQTAAVKEHLPVASEYPENGTETILLAEDDETLRKMTTIILEQMGYTVIAANDGEEAIKKYLEKKNEIRLLLFDVIMPKKSGKEAYEAIKKITPGMKAIFLTGYASDYIRQKNALYENLPIIYKPISPIDLLRKVRSVLNESRTLH